MPTTSGLDTGEHFAKRKDAIQDIMRKVVTLVYCLYTRENNTIQSKAL
jgi:hypothetical protein